MTTRTTIATRLALCTVALMIGASGAQAKRAPAVLAIAESDDIQLAVNAICAQGGGVVELAAGQYQLVKSLILWCNGLTLRGAGTGTTTLHWNGVDGSFFPGRETGPLPTGVYSGLLVAVPLKAPAACAPAEWPCDFSWPWSPRPSAPLQNVTIEHLTIEREFKEPAVPQPGEVTGLPTNGIGGLWSNDLRVSSVDVHGFGFGIWTAHVDNLSVEHSRVSARDWACILEVAPRGGEINDNVLECPAGLQVIDAEGIAVHHNTMMAPAYGILVYGAANLNVYQNAIADSAFGAIDLSQSYGSAIHHNTICRSPAALIYEPFQDWIAGYPDHSHGNVFHHNTGYGFAKPDDMIQTLDYNASGNAAYANDTFDAGQCPIPVSAP